MSLKALAEAVLARNQQRNSDATDAEKPRNSEGEKVASCNSRATGLRYSLTTDTESNPEDVILALAIRDVGTCELAIPKAKYDPFLILKAVDTLQ